jgi:hypothetical protein
MIVRSWPSIEKHRDADRNEPAARADVLMVMKRVRFRVCAAFGILFGAVTSANGADVARRRASSVRLDRTAPLGARALMTAIEEIGRAHNLDRPRVAYKRTEAGEHCVRSSCG